MQRNAAIARRRIRAAGGEGDAAKIDMAWCTIDQRRCKRLGLRIHIAKQHQVPLEARGRALRFSQRPPHGDGQQHIATLCGIGRSVLRSPRCLQGIVRAACGREPRLPVGVGRKRIRGQTHALWQRRCAIQPMPIHRRAVRPERGQTIHVDTSVRREAAVDLMRPMIAAFAPIVAAADVDGPAGAAMQKRVESGAQPVHGIDGNGQPVRHRVAPGLQGVRETMNVAAPVLRIADISIDDVGINEIQQLPRTRDQLLAAQGRQRNQDRGRAGRRSRWCTGAGSLRRLAQQHMGIHAARTEGRHARDARHRKTVDDGPQPRPQFAIDRE